MLTSPPAVPIGQGKNAEKAGNSPGLEAQHSFVRGVAAMEYEFAAEEMDAE
jgi:hypothetical protein